MAKPVDSARLGIARLGLMRLGLGGILQDAATFSLDGSNTTQFNVAIFIPPGTPGSIGTIVPPIGGGSADDGAWWWGDESDDELTFLEGLSNGG